MSTHVWTHPLQTAAAATILAAGLLLPVPAPAAAAAPAAQHPVAEAAPPTVVCVHRVWVSRRTWNGHRWVQQGYWRCVS